MNQRQFSFFCRRYSNKYRRVLTSAYSSFQRFKKSCLLTPFGNQQECFINQMILKSNSSSCIGFLQETILWFIPIPSGAVVSAAFQLVPTTNFSSFRISTFNHFQPNAHFSNPSRKPCKTPMPIHQSLSFRILTVLLFESFLFTRWTTIEFHSFTTSPLQRRLRYGSPCQFKILWEGCFR